MTLTIAIPDMISPSYFPVIAAVELGYLAREGLDSEVELIFPVTDTCQALHDGAVDYVGGAAHAPLYVFPEWSGCRLLCALSQNMYWFLVVRSDLDSTRGDLGVLKGLRVGAAPGPVDGLREMVRDAGLDPDRDMTIGPVPGTSGAGVSFGVTAAEALRTGKIDAFWANGMGAEVAIQDGVGTVVVDVRRGDGPAGATNYTFASLSTTEQRIRDQPDETRATVRAVVAAQQALRNDPALAAKAAQPHFPPREAGLIAELIARDAPFYDSSISREAIADMNQFSQQLGLLGDTGIEYEQIVATQVQTEWQP